MNAPADVSVIIVNWNTREVLRECAVSVLAETRGLSAEVIVVDNASTDGSAEMVRREFPQVTLVQERRNRGYAAACNRGIRVTRAEHILLLNADILVLNGAIRKTLAFAREVPDAGVVTCRVLAGPAKHEVTCFRFPGLPDLAFSVTGLSRLFPEHHLLAGECMGWWDRTGIREVESVTGCFMLVRRSVANQVGPMDESFFMYAEEADWCYRFHKQGYRNLFFGGAEVLHVGGGRQSTRKVRILMHVTQRKSLVRFFAKHRGYVSAFLANLMFASGDAARLVSFASRKAIRALGRCGAEKGDADGARYAASLRFHLTGRER